MTGRSNSGVTAPPALDLAFDWVKNVLAEQGHAADALDSKATTLFSVATIILGLGVSAGILSLKSLDLASLIFGGFVLSSYGFVIGYTFAAIKLRRFETLDNPIEIRKWYWDMEPSQFKIELLTHLEGSYSRNEAVLIEKAKAIRYLIVATASEVLFLVALLAFGLS
jgi:hypothetical protein